MRKLEKKIWFGEIDDEEKKKMKVRNWSIGEFGKLLKKTWIAIVLAIVEENYGGSVVRGYIGGESEV